MRTLDRDYLATHPEGDEKATITLRLAIPDELDVPANPDGSRPVVTLKATGGTYLQLAQALSGMQENDGEAVMYELITQALSEDQVRELTLASDEDAAVILNARFSEVVIPYRTFTLEMTMESTGSFGGTSTDFVFELTAPSLQIAHPAVLSMTRPANMSEILIGWSPETEEDEEEYSDHVLVVS